MFASRAPTAIILMWRIEDLLRSDLQEFLRGNSDALERALDKVEELRAAISNLRQEFQRSHRCLDTAIPPWPRPRHQGGADRCNRGLFHRRLIDKWIIGDQ